MNKARKILEEARNDSQLLAIDLGDPRLTAKEREALYKLGVVLYGELEGGLQAIKIKTPKELEYAEVEASNLIKEIIYAEKYKKSEIKSQKIIEAYLSDSSTLDDIDLIIKDNPIDVYTLWFILNKKADLDASARGRQAVMVKLEKDIKQLALKEIKANFFMSTYPFDKRGYRAKFCKEMAAQYPVIDSIKTIENLFDTLTKSLKYPAI